MHMLIMINFNYKTLSPANDEFLMRISSEKSKGTTNTACIRRFFQWGYQTYPVLGNFWVFPGLVTARKGRGKPGSLPAQSPACEISWKLWTVYFSPAWHKEITCSELHWTCCAFLEGLLPGAQHHTEMGSRAARMDLFRAQLAHNNWNKLTTVLTTMERDAGRRVSVIDAHHRGITEQFLSHATVPLKFLPERCNWWHPPRRDHNSSWPCVGPRLSWRPVVVARFLARTVLDIYWQKNLKFQPPFVSYI